MHDANCMAATDVAIADRTLSKARAGYLCLL